MVEGRANEKNHRWKGDLVGYTAMHEWLYSHYGKANKCESESCKGISTNYQWANISGGYKRDRSDFRMLCVSCHRLYDYKMKARAKLLPPTKGGNDEA